MHVKLRVLRGSSAGTELTLKGPKFVIGRADDCQMRARSDAISRRHCALLVRADRVTVRDLGSRNGTYVNGVRIEQEQELADGDLLQVGPLEFTVLVQQTSNSRARFAAANSSQSVGDLVGEWLDEADVEEPAVQPEVAETRRFRTDDTEHLVIDLGSRESSAAPDDETKVVTEDEKAAAKPPGETAQKSAPADEAAEGGQTKGETRGKKAIGKLPPRTESTEAPKNTQEAAADMLRKLFNRR